MEVIISLVIINVYYTDKKSIILKKGDVLA